MPDPDGKYVYASVKAGLQVIDTSSLQVVIPTSEVIGTPPVLKVKRAAYSLVE